jgi:hypothetical protein
MLPDGRSERILLVLSAAAAVVLLADVSVRFEGPAVLIGDTGALAQRDMLLQKVARLQSLDEQYEWKGYKEPSNVFADNNYEVRSELFHAKERCETASCAMRSFSA